MINPIYNLLLLTGNVQTDLQWVFILRIVFTLVGFCHLCDILYALEVDRALL